MKEISKVLTVIDPTTQDQPGLGRASWLAKKTGAELELLVCYYNEYLSGDRLFDSPSLEKARDEVIQNQQKHLEVLAEPLRADGITVKTSAVWDHPLHEGVVRHAMATDADIVIKDTHHHSAVARALLTNTDWNLIRTCPTRLWLVNPNEFSDAPVFLAAIDPMNQHDKPAALDDEILQLSKLLADSVGGDVHAFFILMTRESLLPRLRLTLTSRCLCPSMRSSSRCMKIIKSVSRKSPSFTRLMTTRRI